MDKLSIQSNTDSDIAVVTAGGRVDSETAPQFDAELTRISADNKKIVIDLKDIEYLSSAGIRAIVKAAQAAETGGGSVKLASVPDEVQSVLYTVGLNQKITAYANVDEAVTSFNS